MALVCLALVLLLARHVLNLAALERWLHDPISRPVPQGGGEGESVSTGLYRFVRNRLRRERQLEDELTRHQALLEIASEPGRGSCFSAVYPARRVSIAAVTAPASQTSIPR